MKTYEDLKTWLKDSDNKQKMVLAVCFVLVFFVGFGAGGYEKSVRQNAYKPLNNYTTPQPKKPLTTAEGDGQVAGAATATGTAASLTNCIVKGNISSTGKKIYHVQGGAFYNRVKPEQCFNTEAQALAAGFVKSSR